MHRHDLIHAYCMIINKGFEKTISFMGNLMSSYGVTLTYRPLSFLPYCERDQSRLDICLLPTLAALRCRTFLPAYNGVFVDRAAQGISQSMTKDSDMNLQSMNDLALEGFVSSRLIL